MNDNNIIPNVVNELCALQGHTGRIFSLALCKNNDGVRLAASASHDRTVIIWDIEKNIKIKTLKYSDFIWRVFFMHNSNSNNNKIYIFAFISTVDKIYVTDIETGEHIRIIDGRLLYSGLMSLPKHILEISNLSSSSSSSSSISSKKINNYYEENYYIKISILVCSLDDDHVAFIDGETGNVVFVLHDKLSFKKVFRATVTQGENAILIFTTWNAQTKRSTIELCNIYEYDKINIKEEFDGYQMSEKVNIINNDKFYNCKSFLLFEGDSRDGVTSVAISGNLRKEIMCSGHYDSIIRVWDIIEKQMLFCLEGHTDFVVSVAIWRENEPILVSGSSDGTIKVWDLYNYSLITTCEGHTRDVWSVSTTLGPDPLIVSASTDRTVRLWDVNPVLKRMKWERRKEFLNYLRQEYNKNIELINWIDNIEYDLIGITYKNENNNINSDNIIINENNENNKENNYYKLLSLVMQSQYLCHTILLFL